MKFRENQHKYNLLTEINRLDLLEQSIIHDEVLEAFIKKRRQTVNHLKDFRKSQITKSSWRKNRWRYLKGIMKFHNSIKGKRFHRSMSRFLSLRYFPNKRPTRESLEHIKDLALKAISSIRTHVYIEEGYYMSLLEQVELELLAEYILPTFRKIESNLYEDICYDLSADEFECILRVLERDELLKSLCEVSGAELEQVRIYWKETEKPDLADNNGYLMSRFFEVIARIKTSEC